MNEMFQFKPIENLKGKLTCVTLIGPMHYTTRLTQHNSEFWDTVENWKAKTALTWSNQIYLTKSRDFWSVSSLWKTIDDVETYILMYWFENKNDAMLFKLIAANYRH